MPDSTTASSLKGTAQEKVVTDNFPTDALSWLMATCSKVLRESLQVRFSKAGFQVTPEQWAILARLFQQDGLSQQTLANLFHRSKVAAFQLISRLESQGLIVRGADPGDGRANLIYLTPAGRSIQAKLVALAQENMGRALAGISEADLETAKMVIRKIIANVK